MRPGGLFVDMAEIGARRLAPLDGLLVSVVEGEEVVGVAEVMYQYEAWGLRVWLDKRDPVWLTDPDRKWTWNDTFMRAE